MVGVEVIAGARGGGEMFRVEAGVLLAARGEGGEVGVGVRCVCW